LILALTGIVTHGSGTSIIDSRSSKHMTGYKDSFSELVQKDSSQKVKLDDDYQYPIKGVGETYYKLDSGKPMKMKDVLYALGLKKNLLWMRKSIDDVVVIGVQEGGLYKLNGHLILALVHSTTTPSEVWHRIFSHIHYKSINREQYGDMFAINTSKS
jgi:hypothetical protein